MQYKEGVDGSRLRPQIYSVFMIIEGVYTLFNAECVITSTYEGLHMDGSYHYQDLAIDIRLPSFYTKNTHHDILVAHLIRVLLPDVYDVELEMNHIHVEYDLRKERRIIK